MQISLNLFGIIILSALFLQFLLGLISNLFNLRSLGTSLPDEFNNIFNEEEYKKSQNYTKDKTKFGFIVSTVELLALLIFWFAGGFNYIDVWARGAGFSSVITGIIYMGLLVFAQSMLSLPFSLYSTFVLEERYGFNKTSLKTFILDRIKGVVLGVMIGVPVLYLVLWFFENSGASAWFYVWMFITFFSIAMQYVAPVWIMPLFNKFLPLEDKELKEAIMDYARKVKYSLQDVFIMDGSKRSTKSNAFFTGFGKNKRIALFDTLVEKQSKEELVAILAHEIGHYKKKHIIKGMVISIIHTGFLLYLLSLFLTTRGLYDAFYMEQVSVYAGLLFFGMLYAPVELLLSIVMHVLSRKHEYEADRFARETTGSGEFLISALKKLSKDNLSNLTPHPFYVFLNYSHPTVLQRVRALR